MPTLKSSILDSEGNPFPENYEPAFILSQVGGSILREYLAHKTTLMTGTIGFLLLGSVLLILTLGRFVDNHFIEQNGYPAAGVSLLIGGILLIMGRRLRPRKKIVRLAKVYWKGVFIPFKDSTILVDASEIFPPIRIRHSRLDRVQELLDIAGQLSPENPELSDDQRLKSYSRLSDIFRQATIAEEDIRVIRADTPMFQAIWPNRHKESFGGQPGLVLGDSATNTLQEQISRLAGITLPADSPPQDISRYEQRLINLERDILERWPQQLLEESVKRDRIVGDGLTALATDLIQASLESGLLFYCPGCNEATLANLITPPAGGQPNSNPPPISFLEQQPLRRNPEQDHWDCPKCERSWRKPIPANRLIEELFHPIYDRVLASQPDNASSPDTELEARQQAHISSLQQSLSEALAPLRERIETLKQQLRRINHALRAEERSIEHFYDVLQHYRPAYAPHLQESRKFSQKLIADILEAHATALRNTEQCEQNLIKQAEIWEESLRAVTREHADRNRWWQQNLQPAVHLASEVIPEPAPPLIPPDNPILPPPPGLVQADAETAVNLHVPASLLAGKTESPSAASSVLVSSASDPAMPPETSPGSPAHQESNPGEVEASETEPPTVERSQGLESAPLPNLAETGPVKDSDLPPPSPMLGALNAHDISDVMKLAQKFQETSDDDDDDDANARTITLQPNRHGGNDHG
jgi:hypothetical protein